MITVGANIYSDLGQVFYLISAGLRLYIPKVIICSGINAYAAHMPSAPIFRNYSYIYMYVIHIVCFVFFIVLHAISLNPLKSINTGEIPRAVPTHHHHHELSIRKYYNNMC